MSIHCVYIHGVLNQDLAAFQSVAKDLHQHLIQNYGQKQGISFNPTPQIIFWGDLPGPVDRPKATQGALQLSKYNPGSPVSQVTNEARLLAQTFVFDQFWLTDDENLKRLADKINESTKNIPANEKWIFFAHSAGSFAALEYLRGLKPDSPIYTNLMGLVTFGSPINYTASANDVTAFAQRIKTDNKFWYNVSHAVDPIAAIIVDDGGYPLSNQKLIAEVIIPDPWWDFNVNIFSAHSLYWKDGNLFQFLSNPRNYENSSNQIQTLFFDRLKTQQNPKPQLLPLR